MGSGAPLKPFNSALIQALLVILSWIILSTPIHAPLQIFITRWNWLCTLGFNYKYSRNQCGQKQENHNWIQIPTLLHFCFL